MIPSEMDYWESITDEWKNSRPDQLWRKHSDAINESLLLRWLPKRQIPRLLKTDTFDEAVGEGLTRFLRTRARSVVGMDLSLKSVQAVHRETSLHGVCADVRRLPFEEESFDVVVSNSTLDHFQALDEITMSLRELHRVLRNGGQLIVTLDNLANPTIAARNHLPFTLLHRLGIVPYFVGVTCGPRRLQSMLRQVGFTIHDRMAVMHCPRIIGVQVAKFVRSRTKPRAQEQLLRWLKTFEKMSSWPTRYVTGHFIAIRAEKKHGHMPDVCTR